MFLFRDERVDDKGVDGSLELKIEDRYTNLRSQVNGITRSFAYSNAICVTRVVVSSRFKRTD